MTNTALIALEVVAVLAFILVRQLRVQPIKDNLLKAPLIIGVIGFLNASNYLGSHHVTPADMAGVVAGLVVATVVAWPRSRSMHVWRAADGTWMRRGTFTTIAWWVVAVAGHAATAFLVPILMGEKSHGMGGFESATIMLYLAVSLGAQGLFLEQRLQRTFPGQRRSSAGMAR